MRLYDNMQISQKLMDSINNKNKRIVIFLSSTSLFIALIHIPAPSFLELLHRLWVPSPADLYGCPYKKKGTLILIHFLEIKCGHEIHLRGMVHSHYHLKCTEFLNSPD